MRRSANIRLEPLEPVEQVETPIDHEDDNAFVASAQWQLTRTDLLRAMWVHPDWAKWLGIAAVGLFFTFPIARVIAASIITSAGVDPNGAWWRPVVESVLAAIPLFAFVLVVLRQLRNEVVPLGFGDEHRLDATPEALRYAIGPREQEIAWGSLRRVHTLPGYVLLRFSYRGDVLVPRRAFAERDGGATFIAAVLTRAGDVITTYEEQQRQPKPEPNPMWRAIVWTIVAVIMIAGAVQMTALWFAIKP